MDKRAEQNTVADTAVREGDCLCGVHVSTESAVWWAKHLEDGMARLTQSPTEP